MDVAVEGAKGVVVLAREATFSSVNLARRAKKVSRVAGGGPRSRPFAHLRRRDIYPSGYQDIDRARLRYFEGIRPFRCSCIALN